MTSVVAYRHAAYDTPWWAFPSSRSGRFHRAGRDVAQYLSLHPLGPAAEFLRNNVGPRGDADEAALNLWAMSVGLDGVEHLTFDNCETYGLSPDDLVSDDHEPCRDLADRLRAVGTAGVVVPSAALPGTENLVLFGVRVLHPYLVEPITPETEVPTGHLSDGARPPTEVHDVVRWRGAPHRALEEWKTRGTFDVLQDPLPARW